MDVKDDLGYFRPVDQVTLHSVTPRTVIAGQIVTLPVVIVGLAPSVAGADPWLPADENAQRLAELAGLDPEELPCRFGLANLCKNWMGDKATRSDYERGARSFRFLPGFAYLLAGAEVHRALEPRAHPRSKALRLVLGTRAPRFTWYTAVGDGEKMPVQVAIVPHPSKRNHHLEEPEVVRWTSEFLRSAAWCGDVDANRLWLTASK